MYETPGFFFTKNTFLFHLTQSLSEKHLVCVLLLPHAYRARAPPCNENGLHSPAAAAAADRLTDGLMDGRTDAISPTYQGWGYVGSCV